MITKSWLNAHCRWKKFENCLMKYAKRNKSSPPQAKNFEIRYFSNPGECISFMRIQPPLEKLGCLTWKGVLLISKLSKPPTTFKAPKVKGGGSDMVNQALVFRGTFMFNIKRKRNTISKRKWFLRLRFEVLTNIMAQAHESKL